MQSRKAIIVSGILVVAAGLSGCIGGTPADANASDAPAAAAPGAERALGTPEIGRSAFEVPPPIERDAAAHVEFDITSTEVVGQMADGKTYTYWTFDGQVPGPMLRVREGDTVTVRFHNDATSTMPHNIDFHAVTGPDGGAAALTAAPGDTKSLTFKALDPGLYVYHCAEGNVPMHIGLGMYGLILVEPEEGMAPVDREYYVVQGDFYSQFSRKEKGHHEYSQENADAEDPAWVVFNGRTGSLTGDRALTADVGDTVRLFVGVGGPNKVSSFHVIGEIFDRVYSEGSLTSPPLEDVQTTLIPAGGAAMVEFDVEVPGDYKLVDHSINRVLKGAAGVLTVEGPEDATVFRPG